MSCFTLVSFLNIYNQASLKRSLKNNCKIPFSMSKVVRLFYSFFTCSYIHVLGIMRLEPSNIPVLIRSGCLLGLPRSWLLGFSFSQNPGNSLHLFFCFLILIPFLGFFLSFGGAYDAAANYGRVYLKILHFWKYWVFFTYIWLILKILLLLSILAPGPLFVTSFCLFS